MAILNSLLFSKSLKKFHQNLIEIRNSSSKSKHIILNAFYRPLNGDMKQYETHFKGIFSESSKNLKKKVLAGDFNIIFLDFETNKKRAKLSKSHDLL